MQEQIIYQHILSDFSFDELGRSRRGDVKNDVKNYQGPTTSR